MILQKTTKEKTLEIVKRLLRENNKLIIPNYSYKVKECEDDKDDDVLYLAYSNQTDVLVLFNENHWMFNRFDLSKTVSEYEFISRLT